MTPSAVRACTTSASWRASHRPRWLGEVLSRRRLDTLHTLTTATSGAATPGAAFERALAALAASAEDIPFAIGYQLDVLAGRAQLTGTAGVPPGGPMAVGNFRT